MVFTSFLFGLFFLIIFFVYWQIPKRYQWLVLLVASYYFYFSLKPAYGLLILFTTVIVYFAAMQMEKNPYHKKRYLLISTALVLSQLFFFKYYNLFALTSGSLFSNLNISFQFPQFQLLLPLGISFFTFQTLGYVIDVYHGTAQAEKNFGILALYVSFFPSIASGPIERGWHLLPQLVSRHTFSYSQTVSGLKLFTWGLFKKLVVADNLAIVVNKVFDNLPDYKGLSLLLTMLFFSVQIFADFSGYTDMARGVARMLGFSLFENFKTPYLATSVRDFWRRWHISLSSWLKDYIYIPLGGSRKGEIRTYSNTVVVFIVCGLWHGAALTFAAWGLAHGLIISFERLMDKTIGKKIELPNSISTISTFGIVTFLWVLFRAKDFADALYIYRYSLTGLKYFVSPEYWMATLSQLFKTNVVEMLIALLCVSVIAVTEIIANKHSISQLVSRQNRLVRFTIYCLLVLTIVLLRNTEAYEFIYVQF